MTTGYIFISVESGRENEVKDQLRRIKDVVELYQVRGLYDFVAKVKCPNLDILTRTALQLIKKTPGVNDIRLSTVTKPRGVKDAKKIV